MDTKALETKMKSSAVAGKINCATCFELAKEFKVTIKEIGEMANRLNIRVAKCQLGLFP